LFSFKVSILSVLAALQQVGVKLFGECYDKSVF